jgi:hypothetical protein
MNLERTQKALDSLIDPEFEPLPPGQIDELARAYRLFIQTLAERELATVHRMAA